MSSLEMRRYDCPCHCIYIGVCSSADDDESKSDFFLDASYSFEFENDLQHRCGTCDKINNVRVIYTSSRKINYLTNQTYDTRALKAATLRHIIAWRHCATAPAEFLRPVHTQSVVASIISRSSL